MLLECFFMGRTFPAESSIARQTIKKTYQQGWSFGSYVWFQFQFQFCFGICSQSAFLIYSSNHSKLIPASHFTLYSSTCVQRNWWLVYKCVLHKSAMKRPFSFFPQKTWVSYLPEHSEQSLQGQQKKKCANKRKNQKQHQTNNTKNLLPVLQPLCWLWNCCLSWGL